LRAPSATEATREVQLRRLFRRLLALIAVTSVVVVLALPPGLYLSTWLRHRLLWSLMPGQESTSREALHPDLQPVIESLVADLEAQGWDVRLASVWRSSERQQAIFRLGQISERTGGPPWSGVRGGRSCHNQLRADGRPGSAAVDLVPGGALDLDQKAAFYQDLGAAAAARGLRWGGSFRQANAVWARYGMGWDPAHVEDRTLCLRLRDGG